MLQLQFPVEQSDVKTSLHLSCISIVQNKIWKNSSLFSFRFYIPLNSSLCFSTNCWADSCMFLLVFWLFIAGRRKTKVPKAAISGHRTLKSFRPASVCWAPPFDGLAELWSQPADTKQPVNVPIQHLCRMCYTETAELMGSVLPQPFSHFF